MRGFITTAIFAIGLSASAQTSGTLKGRIHDTNGEPMISAWASVETGGSTIKVSTDIDGNFTIKPLNSGIYVLKIGSVGMEEREFQFEINPDQITFLTDLAFTNDVTVLDGGPVIHGRPLIDPEEPFKITLTAKQIEKNPNLRNPDKLIGGMTAEIKRSEDGELYFRGSRSDGIVQFIDGVKQTGTISGIPGRAIGRVSVYTGSIPAKYGDTTSGVVIMETKSFFELYYARLAGKL